MDTETGFDTILAVYQEEEVAPASKDGMFGAISRSVTRVGALKTGDVATNLEHLCKQIGTMTAGLADVLKGYIMESLELSIDITAKGEVRLIASASTEVRGGLKLTFKRSSA